MTLNVCRCTHDGVELRLKAVVEIDQSVPGVSQLGIQSWEMVVSSI